MKTPTWESSSGALLNLMRTRRNCAMAHLITLRLRDGRIVRWTDWPEDLIVNGKTFRAPCPNPGHAP